MHRTILLYIFMTLLVFGPANMVNGQGDGRQGCTGRLTLTEDSEAAENGMKLTPFIRRLKRAVAGTLNNC